MTAPGQLLAISHYSHDPRASSMPLAQARRFRATDGTIEEIVELRPDIVVGDVFTPPASRSSLARLGIGFKAVPIASTVQASVAQVRDLAAVAGQSARGEALGAAIARAVAQAKPPAGAASRTAIVWQGGGMVAGDGSLIAELLGIAGFRSAAAARGLGQGAIQPLEAMLAGPPQVVFTAGDPRAEQDRLLRHPALDALPRLVRRDLRPGLFYCGGPSIPRALARLGAVRRDLDATR